MDQWKHEYQKWCQDLYFDATTRKELCKICDEEEIKGRFDRELEFGTGGLRGVMGAGTNRINRYTVRKATQGLANYMNLQGTENLQAVIAYDSRHHSADLALETALCLCANGIRVFLFDELRPTPELSFAIRALKCMAGVVITASHNPPEYNGYKVYWQDGAQITSPRDKEILHEIKSVADFSAVKSISQKEAKKAGLLCFIGAEVDRCYLEALRGLVQEPFILKAGAANLKIVYTPLHGAGNMLVQSALESLGFTHIYVVKEQEQPDGDFPTVPSPNPEDKVAFTMALALAAEVVADLVLATDPDADRLGVYVRNSKTGDYTAFTGNMSGMIICEYLLSRKKEKKILSTHGAVVTTIVSGKMVSAACRDYGVTLIETLTGFKYIGEQIKIFEETDSYEYLFGFEESYGYLVGTNARDKDAIGAVITLCEAAVYYRAQGLTLVDQMELLYQKYGYYHESLHTMIKTGADGMAEIAALMTELREHWLPSIGGQETVEFRDYKEDRKIDLAEQSEEPTGLPQADVLYYVLADESWVCIRPSGTEPKVKIYMGARRETMQETKMQLLLMWEELEDRLEGF